MKINAIQLANFRSHKSTVLKDLGPLVLVLGSNGSGKSGLLDAIAYAVTGACRGTDEAGRGYESLLPSVLNGQGVLAQVVLETTAGLVNRTIGQGPKSVVQEKISAMLRLDRAVLRCAMRSQVFLDLDIKEQEALLRSLVTGTVTPEQAQKALGVLLAEINGAALTTMDGVLAAYKFAYETRTALKRVTFETLAAPNDIIFDGQSAASATTQQISDMRDTAAQRAEDISRIRSQAKSQEHLRGEAAGIEKQLQGLRESIAPLRPLPELDILRVKLQADFDKADISQHERLDKARTYRAQADAADTLRAQYQASLNKIAARAGKNTRCETCQQYVDKSTVRTIMDDLADKIAAELKVAESARKAADKYDDGGLLLLPEAEPLNRVLVDITAIKNARQQAKGLKDRLATIKAQLEQQVEVPSDLEYQAVLTAKISLQGHLRYHESVAGIQKAARAHEQRLADFETAVKTLGPGGPVRALHMSGGLVDIIKEISAIALELEVGSVDINPSPRWTVSINGRPAEVLSASERFRVSLAFAAVIAKRTGVNMVCLDGADILDEDNRPVLISLVEALELDQVIVAATATDGNARVEGWTTIHLRAASGVTSIAQPQAV